MGSKVSRRSCHVELKTTLHTVKAWVGQAEQFVILQTAPSQRASVIPEKQDWEMIGHLYFNSSYIKGNHWGKPGRWKHWGGSHGAAGRIAYLWRGWFTRPANDRWMQLTTWHSKSNNPYQRKLAIQRKTKENAKKIPGLCSKFQLPLVREAKCVLGSCWKSNNPFQRKLAIQRNTKENARQIPGLCLKFQLPLVREAKCVLGSCLKLSCWLTCYPIVRGVIVWCNL